MFSFFYTRGSAAYVRGEQIADYLGGKKNPKGGYENDICIYIKILPPDPAPKHTYLDVDDSIKSADYLRTHKELGVIANSKNAYDYLSKSLNRKDITIIPHAHCNYERILRPKREVRTVGIIGSITSFQYPVPLFRRELEKIGLDLIYEPNYWNVYSSSPDRAGRLKVVDFYKNVDIQVVWRPKMMYSYLKNPNKIINAGSFGIPTVAYPEEDWKYNKGQYIEADTIDKMIGECKRLKDDPFYYDKCSEEVLSYSEINHIEHIANLYKSLC